ncbi:MAG: hypothetical protein WBQ44_16030 [Rhodococcus sp. (in: high G+C Gram-positive bacteria)]
MKRALVLLSAVPLLALAACGASDDDVAESSAGNAERAEIGSRVPAPNPLSGSTITDAAVLQTAMLTPTDLPDGYAVLPDPVRDLGLDPAPEYDAPDRSGTDPQRCADVLAPIADQVAGAAADAEVRYAGPNFSSIDEDAASYPEIGAADAFEAVQSTIAECTAFSGTDADGIDVEYQLSGREQMPVGDASTSVRLETTSEGFTLVSDAVVAVVDRTVVQLVVTSQEGVDPDALTALAETAVDRIRGVDKGV